MPHRGCKDINIRNPRTCEMWVLDCLERHYRRMDFGRLLEQYGGAGFADMQFPERRVVARRIAEVCCSQIENRHLDIPPVVITTRRDGSSGKIGQIGCESPLHQCLDFIAVGASKEIHDRRIVPQQCSSIRNRGPLYGAKMIRGWINNDIARKEYAERHGIRYTSLCNWHVKTDNKKCFPNGDIEVFNRHYSRDCGNMDLLWLFEQLLMTHHVNGYKGFMIGALPSEWAMQYLMSFAYRYTTGLHYERHGKSRQMVSYELIFMDDVLYTGPNREMLKKAILMTADYMAEDLHQYIKPDWSIQRLDDHPIDMMGFRIYSSGKMAIRPSIYKRFRRMALRSENGLSLRQSKRVMSYKGYLDHSSRARASERLNIGRVYRISRRNISKHYKEQMKGGTE